MNVTPLDAQTMPRFTERLSRLRPDSSPRWGELQPTAMVSHLRRGLELSLGDLEVEDISNPLTRTVMKWVAFSALPWPRGRIKSPSYFFPTSTSNLDTEREQLQLMMHRFVEETERDPTRKVRSPLFGPMTLRYWRRVHGKHMDHHLRQFGV